MTTRLFPLALVAALVACDDLPFSGDDEPADEIVELSAADSRTCALTREGDVYCWGNNGGGALGDGTIEPRIEPVRVRLPGPASSVHGATCALVDRVLHCWGARSSFFGEDTTIAATAYAPSHRWRFVSRDIEFHACGIDTDRRAWCWGWNYGGELGDGTRTENSEPVLVEGDMQWREIAVGNSMTCGITVDDRGWCWGSNNNGRLGIGYRAGFGVADDRRSPEPLAGDHRWRTIDIASDGACGITLDGDAMCWGHSVQAYPDELVPAEAPYSIGLTGQRITVGDRHVCVISGTIAHCWGSNDFGQLGSGDFNEPPSPLPVSTPSAYAEIEAGAWHTCALTARADVECWGLNGQLQLGDGTAIDRASPVSVSQLE